MATYLTSNATGLREDLRDTIMRVDPAETPLVSNLTIETVNAVTHEWLVQELASASDTNHANEGADFSFVNPTATTRLTNVCQIAVQAVAVSNTLETVDKAGRDREMAYVSVIKGLEQKRDINKSLYKNEAKSSSDPRKCGKLITYLTNGSKPSDGGFATGDGSDTADLTLTARALTLALIDEAMLSAYTDGGNPSVMFMSPTNKQNFSDLSSGSVATNQITMTAPTDITIVGSASIFLTDFGELAVVTDRVCPDSEIYLVDTDHVCLGYLKDRSFKQSDVSPTGDALKSAIVSEYTLIPKAPKAHAVIIGLNGS